MSVEEAKLILGVDNLNHLTIGEINKKHRQTMLSNHPDKGGSPYMAMKINEAKDILEQQIPQKKRRFF
jgi:DnaJ family protein C protein 19